MNPVRFRGAMLAVATLGVVACSDPTATADGYPAEARSVAATGQKPGQVAARINGEELTVHQINDRLAAWSPPGSEAGPQSQGVGLTLNRLVELTLLRQEAEAQGLAQRPDVLRALQGARADVLARALAQQIGEEETTPPPHVVRRYYDEHPEAFARRRVFHIREVRAKVQTDEAVRLTNRPEGLRDPKVLAQSLEKAGHRSLTTHLQVASDQLPLPQLRRLQQLGVGQAMPIEDGEGLRVWWVQAAVDQPLEWEQAQPAIERLLLTRARAERLRREMERLRDRSQIEFIGEFSRWAPATTERAASTQKSNGESTQGAVGDAAAR